MDAGNWLTWNNWERRLGGIPKASTGLFGLGIFLGIIAVSMWQQWSLTFGLDPQLLLAVSVVLSLAIGFGHRQQPGNGSSTGRTLAALILGLSLWSLIHPFWIESLTTLMGKVPMTWVEGATTKPFVAMSLAVLGWIVPGILWSAVISIGAKLADEINSSIPRAYSLILSGVACGLLLDSLVLAPTLGVLIPTLVASILASGIGLRLHLTMKPSDVAPTAKTVEMIGAISAMPIRLGMAGLVGVLLACNLRLVNQLMPHGAFVIDVEFAGVMFGIAVGLVMASHRRFDKVRAPWGGLLAAAASSALLAAQPSLVDLSLRMNSSLTSVASLLAVRAALLTAIACPFGMALAWIADSTEDDTRRGLVVWGMPFGIGLGTATFLLGGIVGMLPLMAGCGTLLVIASGFLRIRSVGLSVSFRAAVGMGCLVAMALSLPMWRSCDNASRTAKLLFSTPTFLAYRYGWDIAHLPLLDDVRMIDRLEGDSGPLTLWRGRVAELYVREAGIPRAVVTKNSDAVPQFAPEVLQAVYSLVLVDRPGRVLLLGLSAGVPLSTCLNFPVRELVCYEGDAHLIDLVRGPIARETGYDPLTDDRVTLRRISPELALMVQPAEPFDVILSSPSSSSMTDGAASFTREFYQRASLQLSERGLFCQRFECVDYGLEPIQLVVKAMRSAFRRVIAIETASGELMLLAANSEEVFIPSDLATRLEKSHVCKVLARSGLDWSALLNLPAYDHEALKEICDESHKSGNSAIHGQLAAFAPMEVMRWGNKLQEVQNALTATRISKAPFWTDSKGQPNSLDQEIQLSRRSRLVEWLGDSRVSQELLRRLGEVVTQQKLVRDYPDAHWWAYRKTLRKQLQDHPRTVVQPVKAIDEKQTLHPEDVHRQDYFIALGNAAKREHPTRKQITAIEECLEPYDPLVSYFARQEIANLLARAGEDAATELAYRLHVIFFAPTIDGSVRNVATALETLITHPDTLPDNSIRFDALNGLIQTLRVRWEVRQSIPETSSKKILDDVDQSLLAIEKGLVSLDSIATSAGVTEREWRTRKKVIERLMVRPLRTYRIEVQARLMRGQAQAKSIIEEENPPMDDENEEEDAQRR